MTKTLRDAKLPAGLRRKAKTTTTELTYTEAKELAHASQFPWIWTGKASKAKVYDRLSSKGLMRRGKFPVFKPREYVDAWEVTGLGQAIAGTPDSTRAKAATKMGAVSPSRSRQVAARPNRQPDTATYSGRVARRMRKLRKAKKMSIDELRIALESTGVVMVNSALYAYENGNRQINPDHYPALAKVLGCESVRDFLPSR